MRGPTCTLLRSFRGRQIILPIAQSLPPVFLLSQGGAETFSTGGLLPGMGIQAPGLQAPVPRGYRKALGREKLEAAGLKELLSHVELTTARLWVMLAVAGHL